MLNSLCRNTCFLCHTFTSAPFHYLEATQELSAKYQKLYLEWDRKESDISNMLR